MLFYKKQLSVLCSVFFALFLFLSATGAKDLANSDLTNKQFVANNNANVIPGSDNVKASLIADTDSIVAGKPFKLAIEFFIKPHWHIYYKDSGEAGMPTKIEWTLPEGFKASDLLWQRPNKFTDSGITTYGYKEHTVIAATITPSDKLKAGSKLQFAAKVKWLGCNDTCIPGKAQLEINLPVRQSSKQLNEDKFAIVNFNGPVTAAVQSLPDSSRSQSASVQTSIVDRINVKANKNSGIIFYLLMAFIGGFILNFMPCVLPVISIKIFSFIEQAGSERRKIIKHGLAFAAGIIISFLLLGLVVIALQNAGHNIGWGFQFQYPVFVLSMACLVTVFAQSFFGVFYINAFSNKNIEQLARDESEWGSFFKGVLATILSTPCTAPFLGTALGFAFAQPWWLILVIFFIIALGMAWPYLLLTMQPEWMKFLPKPGAWMEKLKVGLGFLLLATAVWLVWVLSKEAGTDAALAVLAFLLCLSFAFWVVGNFIEASSSSLRQIVVWLIALGIVGTGFSFFIKPFPELLSTGGRQPARISISDNKLDSGIAWQPFSSSLLDKATSNSKTVFVDFTADWCLTCKANEQAVINTAPVIAKFKELNIVPLKADWTWQDQSITKILEKFGRSGVPLYVIFPAGKPTQPIILPELITQSIVLDALSKAGSSQ